MRLICQRPDLLDFDTDLENAWFGVTVTRKAELWRIDVLRENVRAILAGVCTAYIWIDRVTAYRQTGLGHDILCFHLTNEDSIYYFCHDLCTSNTLLNSSGIS